MNKELLKKKRTWAALLAAAALAWSAYSGRDFDPELLNNLADNLSGIVQTISGPEQSDAVAE